MKLMSKAPQAVAKKLRESLKRWAENEFANDAQLSLIPSLYAKLKTSYDFSASETVSIPVILVIVLPLVDI